MKPHLWMWIVLTVAASAAPVQAKATWTKKAQAEDPAIKSCLACHTSNKVTAKNLQLNARGQFLVDREKERNAKETDLAWLKDYKEADAKKPAPDADR